MIRSNLPMQSGTHDVISQLQQHTRVGFTPLSPPLKLLPPCACAKSKPPSSYTCLPLVILNLTLSSHTPYWHFNHSRPDRSCPRWEGGAKKTQSVIPTFTPRAYFSGSSSLGVESAMFDCSSLPGWPFAKCEAVLECARKSSRSGPSLFDIQRRFQQRWGHRSGKGPLIFFFFCRLFLSKSKYEAIF